MFAPYFCAILRHKLMMLIKSISTSATIHIFLCYSSKAMYREFNQNNVAKLLVVVHGTIYSICMLNHLCNPKYYFHYRYCSCFTRIVVSFFYGIFYHEVVITSTTFENILLRALSIKICACALMWFFLLRLLLNPSC